MKPTMLISGVLFLALVGQVELFKLFKQPVQQPAQQPAPQPQQPESLIEQERLYPQARPLLAPNPYFAPPLIQQQTELVARQPEPNQTSGTKGGVKGDNRLNGGLIRAPQAPLPLLPQPLLQQQPAYSYLVVRPIQPQAHQYQFLDPYRFGARGGLFGSHLQALRPAPVETYLRQNEQPAPSDGTKGGQRPIHDEEQQQQQEIVEQQQQQVIEQQHEIQEQQPEPAPLPPAQQQQQAAIVIPITPGKEGKLRALLDKIRSKLTLGSTYEVVGEEIVQPAPPAQQPQPQPIQQQVEEQQIEQQQQGFQEEQQQQQQIVQEQKVEQQQPASTKGLQSAKQEEIKGQPARLQQEEIKATRLEEAKGNLIGRYEETKQKRYPERPSIQQQQTLAVEQIRQNEQSAPKGSSAGVF